jgi:hypothetical protein
MALALLFPNSATLTLSAGTATPGRAKHALRRWAAIRMRVASGACRVVKVDTDSMPVDFMTKHKGHVAMSPGTSRSLGVCS